MEMTYTLECVCMSYEGHVGRVDGGFYKFLLLLFDTTFKSRTTMFWVRRIVVVVRVVVGSFTCCYICHVSFFNFKIEINVLSTFLIICSGISWFDDDSLRYYNNLFVGHTKDN